jgi:hypothetical protein
MQTHVGDMFRKSRQQQNIYYEILPMMISGLALFGAFKFFNLLTPILTNFLKACNCYLKSLCSDTKKCKKPKVKQMIVTCTPIK